MVFSSFKHTSLPSQVTSCTEKSFIESIIGSEGATTVSITTFCITTVSITTFSITTFSITALCHCADCHYAKYRGLFIVMLNFMILSVVILSFTH